MPGIPGIVDVDTTLKLDKPELLVEINRELAADLGVEAREIAETLRVAVGGDDRVSRYRDATVDDAYDVELRLVNLDRRDVQSISQLYVRANPSPAASGIVLPVAGAPRGPALTRIDNVVDFHFGVAPARIDRLERQRMVALRANVAPGYALGDRTRVGADAIGFRLDLRPVVHFHVYPDGGPVRESGPPIHDPPLAAAGRAVRAH
jgi:multidrug efflux pump subunit AcrB